MALYLVLVLPALLCHTYARWKPANLYSSFLDRALAGTSSGTVVTRIMGRNGAFASALERYTAQRVQAADNDDPEYSTLVPLPAVVDGYEQVDTSEVYHRGSFGYKF